MVRCTPQPLPDALWPFAAIEVMVLGCGDYSLPLEIGFARWRGVDEPIECWSTQIRPEVCWLGDACWSTLDDHVACWAQRCLSDHGLPVAALCRRLNAELYGATVCCEGLAPAQIALAQLYTAAETKPSFDAIGRLDLEALAKPGMKRWLDANDRPPTSPRTRAAWILRAFASGLKRRPKRVVIL